MDAATHSFVRDRAGNRCEFCRLPAEGHEQPFSIDHVVARKHRGSDDVSNLALACLRCNLHKGTDLATFDPESGALTRLYNPRIDRWEEHFVLRADRIEGVSATGRSTTALLQFNASSRLALRQALIAEGLFP